MIDGTPLIIVRDGEPILHLMHKARVDEGDILAAARESQGLKTMAEIEYAVLARSGSISIIPKKDAGR